MAVNAGRAARSRQQGILCIFNVYTFLNSATSYPRIYAAFNLFPYKDRLNRSQMSKIIFNAGCWDCDVFYIDEKKNDSIKEKLNIAKALG